MDIDREIAELSGEPVKATKPKKVKKPAAKKAKKVPTKRKAAKPKTKKKPAAKKPPKRKPAKKSRPARPVVRTERLDMRLSKAEKSKVSRIAKKLKRTLTSVVYEAIEKLK